MLGVVRSSLLGGNIGQLHALDNEASALDAAHDLADVMIAHSVGLEHGVGLFNCHDCSLS